MLLKGQLDTVVGSAILVKWYLQAGEKPKSEMHFKGQDTELLDSSLLSSLIVFINSH